MESHLATHSPISPLRSTSSTNAVEEEYEASASSMAEDSLDNDKDDDGEEKGTSISPKNFNVMYNKNKHVENYYHQRMSSGNSSTDGSISMPTTKSSKLNKKHKVAPYRQRLSMSFPLQTHHLVSSRKRLETGYGLISGYDGDTEGSLIDDKHQ